MEVAEASKGAVSTETLAISGSRTSYLGACLVTPKPGLGYLRAETPGVCLDICRHAHRFQLSEELCTQLRKHICTFTSSELLISDHENVQVETGTKRLK